MAALPRDVPRRSPHPAPPPAAFRALEIAAVDGHPIAARHFAPPVPARGVTNRSEEWRVPSSFCRGPER